MTKRLVVVCLAIVFLAAGVAAQRLTGSLSGLVTDPQGLAVPGAKVTVSNQATGFQRELKTGDDGSFLLIELAPATYKVVVSAENFKTFQTNVTVYVGVTATLTAKLEIGVTTEVMEIAGTAISVDPVRNVVQGTVTGQQIDQLPLNGRNFLDLAQQAPGVQIVDGGNFDPTKNQFVGVSIGGRSGRVTRIQVDGVDITDETVGTTVANISNETIQEFTVAQSSLDPSTDVTSSGAVNIVSRSGGNEIHGSGFFFWRDESFAADQRLTKVGDKPPFDREQGGGRVGGPFVRDKWFWHFEFEKSNQDGQRVTNVPEFPTFTGAFAVPVDENLGGAKTDYVISSRWKAFYRYMHNDNNGVTGFGARDLAAFSNRNNTNIHLGGADFGGTRWTHSFRHSYLNFNNFIAPSNVAAGTPLALNNSGQPDPSGSFDLTEILIRIDGRLQDLGPDLLAPQQTFQDNRQTKYDGGVTIGRHTIRFGAEHNRIEQFVFASFFGLAPRIRASFNSTTRAFADLNRFGPGGQANPLNFPNRQIVLGNGLGFFSEKPALGFPFGGAVNHRLAFYAHDQFKWTSNFTFNYGVRYSYHTNLSNSDLPRAPLIGLFDQQLVGTPRRDTDDFGPQAGFAWNIFGNNKTIIRGGAGIFYETNIFNNFLFDRVVNIPPGVGNDTPVISSTFTTVLHPATGAVLFDFATQCTNANPGSTTPNSCIGAPIGNVAPFAVQAQQLLQAASLALSQGYPQPGVPPLFNAILDASNSLLDPDYKTPYGAQMNIGFQHELRSGLVVSVDYIRNRGVHFNLTRDRNRIGAADTLNVANAIAAIQATIDDFDCANGTLSAGIDCVIADGGSITDFAAFGLDAGGGLDGFAFSGRNPNFRTMGIIEPQGLSLFQALQVQLHGDLGKWERFGVRRLFVNINYQLGRFESTGVDQDFLSTAAFNDRPTKFFGPANLDRSHQITASFLVDLPYGFTVNTTSAFRTAFANSLFVPQTEGIGEIFFSDLDGDGVIEDPIGSSNRGSFGRDIKASDIAGVIARHNSTVAGTFTPAAQALVNAGLFSAAQLQSLGAVIPTVAAPPSGQVDNDSFINTDIRISNRIKITERFTVEPMLEIFNLFNVANYTAFTNFLDGGPGDANGTTASTRPTRVGQGSGSFSPGTQRAFQFGVRVSF